MHTTFLCLAVLFLVQYADAAPAPDDGRLPKQKLGELKKKLPDILDEWKKTRVNNVIVVQGSSTKPGAHVKIKLGKPELRVFRRVGPERAKVVILFPYHDETGERIPRQDVLLTIYLSYQDGCWTTERSESFNNKVFFDSTGIAFLMLAIDEAAGK